MDYGKWEIDLCARHGVFHLGCWLLLCAFGSVSLSLFWCDFWFPVVVKLVRPGVLGGFWFSFCTLLSYLLFHDEVLMNYF